MGGDCPCSDGKDAAAFRECGPGLSAGTGDLAAFCETGHRAETVFLHLRSREREELYRTVAELAKEKHLEIINLRYGKPLRHKEFQRRTSGV